MIRIGISFYDKTTDLIASESYFHLPDQIVFMAAGSEDISYINASPFEVSNEMKNYIIKNHPESKEKFDIYLYSAIGRHGLGPEYG